MRWSIQSLLSTIAVFLASLHAARVGAAARIETNLAQTPAHQHDSTSNLNIPALSGPLTLAQGTHTVAPVILIQGFPYCLWSKFLRCDGARYQQWLLAQRHESHQLHSKKISANSRFYSNISTSTDQIFSQCFCYSATEHILEPLGCGTHRNIRDPLWLQKMLPLGISFVRAP